jgi:DNA polymerase III epsilon subunit-like protein
MSRKICFIYTETTGLHQGGGYVSKKELFKYARMVTLNYEIGCCNVDNMKEFVIEKKVRSIVKPRNMYIPKDTEQYHGINMEMANSTGVDPSDLIKQLKNDLMDVDVIVSHNVEFHFKTILAEAVRYNINLDLSNYIVIDTIGFFHNYGFIKLKDLATKLKIKNIPEKPEQFVELIRNVFLKLYHKFEKAQTQTTEQTMEL